MKKISIGKNGLSLDELYHLMNELLIDLLYFSEDDYFELEIKLSKNKKYSFKLYVSNESELNSVLKAIASIKDTKEINPWKDVESEDY